MERTVCKHFAPINQHCVRCDIPADSLAGILLREHDSPEQAAKYAERKADLMCAMGNAMGLDYSAAAKLLRSSF